ncbi:hypothetical protein F2Q70_00039086 [Brassica cretica]|uniref:Uncharacterized protein n=1 Tax=Brassica cretica TaxID=69181 RepID=A0A8S9K7M1_BRACR|nr:hypothetical protein F2Q70_00039086 [Brassica cretica]
MVGRIFRMHGASHQIIPDLRKMNSDLPSLPALLVGGRERELPGHLDQGDLIREGGIGVGVGVALPEGGGELPQGVSLPWIAWRRACSPYRKLSISRKRGRSLGLVPGYLLAGTWSVPISGSRGSGSCLEAGGNDTGVFFPNSLPLIVRFRHRTRGITSALKSTGIAHSQQAPLRKDSASSVSLSWIQLKPELVLNPGKDHFHLT